MLDSGEIGKCYAFSCFPLLMFNTTCTYFGRMLNISLHLLCNVMDNLKKRIGGGGVLFSMYFMILIILTCRFIFPG